MTAAMRRDRISLARVPPAAKTEFRVEIFDDGRQRAFGSGETEGMATDSLGDALRMARSASERFQGAAILYRYVGIDGRPGDGFVILATVGDVPRQWVSAFVEESSTR